LVAALIMGVPIKPDPDVVKVRIATLLRKVALSPNKSAAALG
jgi:hypothetical protein